jgi:hypothetical protein
MSMNMKEHGPADPTPVSFLPLLAALAVGVVTVAVCVAETASNPTIGLLLCVVAMLGFAGVVLHQVGRLLGDDGSAS